MKNVLSIGFAALSVIALSGCSMFSSDPEPEHKPRPIVEHDPLPTVDYGVSYFEDRESFVVYESGYEHVVLPDGRTVAYKPSWDDSNLSAIANQLDGKPPETKGEPSKTQSTDRKDLAADDTGSEEDEKPEPMADADDQPTTEKPLDRKESAWDKLCRDDIAAMSEGDFFLVMTTDMPEMFKDWCDRDVAFSRLK